MKELTDKVIYQLGFNPLTDLNDPDLETTLQDVSNHGADAGFSGFTYYTDTVAFFDANKSLIIEALKEEAESFDMGLLEMVKDVLLLDGRYSLDEIGLVIFGDDPEDTQIKNALAWFALETVARFESDL